MTALRDVTRKKKQRGESGGTLEGSLLCPSSSLFFSRSLTSHRTLLSERLDEQVNSFKIILPLAPKEGLILKFSDK